MLDEYKKQQHICDFFLNSVKSNKISHAYLIEENGNDGFEFVIAITKFLLCVDFEDNKEFICNLIDNNNYPELYIISPDGKEIKKEQMLELKHVFSTKPVFGKYRICIIRESNKFNSSSANSILKFLEEPAENIIIFLLANDQHKVISTIASRCQILTMSPNNQPLDIEKYLIKTFDDENSIDKEETEKLENKIFEIIIDFEMKGSNVLADKEIYNFKEKFDIFLTIALLIYQDVLNCKIGRDLKTFVDKSKEINYICSRQELDDIIKKINIILRFLGYIHFNVNKDLIISNFIISLEEGDEVNA
ncbi:MAG TPA: hypothetical protein PLT65_03205 [Bacilli bacterium]|nr:hypothetical protein [Bacilli bacterium]